jgi:hypothetical protein
MYHRLCLCKTLALFALHHTRRHFWSLHVWFEVGTDGTDAVSFTCWIMPAARSWHCPFSYSMLADQQDESMQSLGVLVAIFLALAGLSFFA